MNEIHSIYQKEWGCQSWSGNTSHSSEEHEAQGEPTHRSGDK